ncbi:hypothetical protein LT493_22240 [Streptomyces tricolor]|nr:hypothetical protein [Streptomyces tricolor]
MLQECLNRSGATCGRSWTNGRQLRLLRDSSALATASYVEFDLAAISTASCSASSCCCTGCCTCPGSRRPRARARPPPAGTVAHGGHRRRHPRAGPLAQGRAGGDHHAGHGFSRHPDNGALRAHVRPRPAADGAAAPGVFRLLFVLRRRGPGRAAGTDADPLARRAVRATLPRRGCAPTPAAGAARRTATATRRCAWSWRRSAGRAAPSWACRAWAACSPRRTPTRPLRGLKPTDEALLTAVRRLSLIPDGGAGRRRAVDHRQLGAEELRFGLRVVAGAGAEVQRGGAALRTGRGGRQHPGRRRGVTTRHRRWSTSAGLSASIRVVEDAVRRGTRAAAPARGEADPAAAVVRELLSLKVCDPACGSGHFLVAAARRIAKRVAAVWERTPEPTPDAVRHALREVVARCVYGVDLNPMAVELAKVSRGWRRWSRAGRSVSSTPMSSTAPGLIGATPRLLADGVRPTRSGRSRATTGRPRPSCSSATGPGARDRDGPRRGTAPAAGDSRWAAEPNPDHGRPRRLAGRRPRPGSPPTAPAPGRPDTSGPGTRPTPGAPRSSGPALPDAPAAPTDQAVRALRRGDRAAVPGRHARRDPAAARGGTASSTGTWSSRGLPRCPGPVAGVRPETGWAGGFDVVLGNPPWERVKLQEREFFAGRSPPIARAKNAAARKRAIAELREAPGRAAAVRGVRGGQAPLRGRATSCRVSGGYPLTGRG